jgi:hypothetical protein
LRKSKKKKKWKKNIIKKGMESINKRRKWNIEKVIKSKIEGMEWKENNKVEEMNMIREVKKKKKK